MGNSNNCKSGVAAPCTWTASYIDTTGIVVGTVGSGTKPSTAVGVKVVPVKTYTSFLTSLLGMQDISVTTSASAIYGSLSAANCLSMFPSTLNGDTGGETFANWTLNSCYLIKDDNGAAGGGGSFGWVNLDGGSGGSSELENWISNYATSGNNGCNSTITVGTASANLDTTTGNKANLQAAVLSLIKLGA